MIIYCVEDDISIRELEVYTLRTTGFEAAGFGSGEDFFAALNKMLPDLILLDVMLPDMDGMTILKRIRATRATKKIPVIMVTARSSEYDKVIGLDSGADDYIAKPFGMMELISRIKAVLRRSQPKPSSLVHSVGGITIYEDKHKTMLDGKEAILTLKEFELLNLLMKNEGIVLTRDTLLENIWGYDFDGETRTVDVHIRTLRQKLGDQGRLIKTIRGVGYSIGSND